MKARYAVHVDGFQALVDSDRERARRVMLSMSVPAGSVVRLVDTVKGRVIETRRW